MMEEIKEAMSTLCGLVKAVISSVGNTNFITGTFTNLRSKDYNISTITIASPYGSGSFPLSGIDGLLVTLEGSSSTYVCAGFMQEIPPTPHTPLEGESWNFSRNYTLMFQNNGLIAYRINDDTYTAPIISGSWANKIFQDLIEDNNVTLRDYINDQINIFLTTHTHTGITTGGGISGPSVQTIMDIATNATLEADDDAITDGETLIANGGTNP